jgi:hypothetical protein
MNVTRAMCQARMVLYSHNRRLFFSCFGKVPSAIAGDLSPNTYMVQYDFLRIMIPGRGNMWCEEWVHPHYSGAHNVPAHIWASRPGPQLVSGFYPHSKYLVSAVLGRQS